MKPVILDCTLRDGGYYNSWDFNIDVTNQYLTAMQAAGVDIVELGLRSLLNEGFKGANAYTSESYLDSLTIPDSLEIAVMVNASELVAATPCEQVLTQLFPEKKVNSKISIVRIACHVHEFSRALPASHWLKANGYKVGFNLMQVADRTQPEVEALAKEASKYPIDVLYFADSMGSMDPSQTTKIITWLNAYWKGAIGIHTHDNMGLALQNTLQSIKDGATWLDSTVTGMGRGPGNARTEELVIELSELRNQQINMVPLMGIIRAFFQPLKNKCGWGSNPYYYLSGKYGIHPTYIQEMLSDNRYSEEDIFAAISHLKVEGGKKFSLNTLDQSRQFYTGPARGSWNPKHIFTNKDVLLLGSGPGVLSHRAAIESYIKSKNPIVVALNTQSGISQELINFRIACHPIRLLADCETHVTLPQPLITPASMLPTDVKSALGNKNLLDFGIEIEHGKFKFEDTYVTLPSSLVISYALAIFTSGKANTIYMAGFDGYSLDDPRTHEIQNILNIYSSSENAVELIAVTPTKYSINTKSIYAM